MNISEITSKDHRELAEMRGIEQCGNLYDNQTSSFTWYDTPEGDVFWSVVELGSYPPIPASSMAELEEWRKRKEPVKEGMTADEKFDEQAHFNKWLNELTEPEQQHIIDMLEEYAKEKYNQGVRDAAELTKVYWKFDDYQHPTSSWHDKNDLIEALEKLIK